VKIIFKSKKTLKNSKESPVVLYRGKEIVGDLLSSFGDSLKETRLTAALGYILSGYPDGFLKRYGFSGVVTRVLIEHVQGPDRTDIVLETTKGYLVIEAKTISNDPAKQINRYYKRFRRLGKPFFPIALVPYGQEAKQSGKIYYLPWGELAKFLDSSEFKKRLPIAQKFMLGEVLKYMERHGLIRDKAPKEIYAREINDEQSLDLFLKHHLYQCEFEKKTQLNQANYFAPHFGEKIESWHSGIRQGISYVSRIETVVVIESREEYRDAILKFHGKTYFKKHQKEMMYPVKKNGRLVLSLVFVEEPKLVFNPPIVKEYLQKGKGWLSKQAYSFDDFFKAMHREYIFEK
jgi:hypothetical protein